VYKHAEPELIIVYGLRFAGATSSDELQRDRRIRESTRVMRIAIGSILAVVHGGGGPCARAIGAYLQSLAK
jgi:hypothetical protein